MANPNPDQSGLEQGKWKPGQSGNPAGKPKGAKHLSTHIQEMLNDEDFEIKLKDGTLLKERPIKAIIKTAVAKSISGDNRWAEWLAKHGYGIKQIHEFDGAMPYNELDEQEKAKFSAIMGNGQDQSTNSGGGGGESQNPA